MRIKYCSRSKDGGFVNGPSPTPTVRHFLVLENRVNVQCSVALIDRHNRILFKSDLSDESFFVGFKWPNVREMLFIRRYRSVNVWKVMKRKSKTDQQDVMHKAKTSTSSVRKKVKV